MRPLNTLRQSLVRHACWSALSSTQARLPRDPHIDTRDFLPSQHFFTALSSILKAFNTNTESQKNVRILKSTSGQQQRDRKPREWPRAVPSDLASPGRPTDHRVSKGQAGRRASARSSTQSLPQGPVRGRLDHPRAPARRGLRRRSQLPDQVHLRVQLQLRAHQEAHLHRPGQVTTTNLPRRPRSLHPQTTKGLDPQAETRTSSSTCTTKYRVGRQPLEAAEERATLDAAVDLQTRIPLYRPKIAAHLNYIFARDYSLKVEYQGHLTMDSVKKLLDIAKPHLANKLTFKG